MCKLLLRKEVGCLLPEREKNSTHVVVSLSAVTQKGIAILFILHYLFVFVDD